jgi:hypothetical protein
MSIFGFVELNKEYIMVELNYMNEDILNWCTDNFGPQGTRWFSRWPRIYFTNKQDHMMFLLRFS